MKKINYIPLVLVLMIGIAKQATSQTKSLEHTAAHSNTSNAHPLETTESNRVLKALNISDKAKKESVRNLLVRQYQQIQKTVAERDSKMKDAVQSASNKVDGEKKAAEIWADYQILLSKRRDTFTNALSTHLSADQVELVQNTMTDDRLHKEFTLFQALLPNMTEPQKKQVYNYLLEARSNAMNVLSEEDRLKWFDKFRGRANNYLAKQGYNLRKATEDLEARQKAE